MLSLVSDASYCPAQAFGCFAPYIKLNSMKIRCYDVVLAKQSGLTVFVKRQMVEFVGSLYPCLLLFRRPKIKKKMFNVWEIKVKVDGICKYSY